jgi:hypothetical protein
LQRVEFSVRNQGSTAMQCPPTPGPGLDGDAGVLVCEGDGFPDVDPALLRELGKLVRERDVHVAAGVLHQFDELRRPRVCLIDLPADEGPVDGGRPVGRVPVVSADNAAVACHLLQGPSGYRPFGAMGVHETPDSETALLEPRDNDTLTRPGRDGRFEDDEVALVEVTGDRLGRFLDVREVGDFCCSVERRRDGNQEDVCGFRLGFRDKPLFCMAVQVFDPRLPEREVPVIQAVDHALLYVDAYNVRPVSGKQQRGRQSYVS